MRTPKKPKSPLRAAFVLTASLGATITGCDGSLASGENIGGGGGGDASGASGGGGSTPCPPTTPPYGNPCSGDSVCAYDAGCGDTETASCIDDAWQIESDAIESCNPPAPCPEEVPVEGEYCNDDGGFGGPYNCQFTVDTPCGAQAIVANCTDHPQRDWTVWRFEAESCTSTAADCASYVSESLCGADTACRWLAPACGDPEKFVPGACYPIDDCTAESCAPSELCTAVTHDPCWGIEACEAGCTADASICQPAP